MGLDISGFGAAFDFAKGVLDRVVPDPTAKAQAQAALLQLQQNGQLAQLTAQTDLAKGQLAVDQAEAANPNLFVAGWRPFIGWVCGCGLAYQYVVSPFLTWGSDLFGHKVVGPSLDLGTLVTLLFGMLGLGAMRTYEKVSGLNPGH